MTLPLLKASHGVLKKSRAGIRRLEALNNSAASDDGARKTRMMDGLETRIEDYVFEQRQTRSGASRGPCPKRNRL